MEEAKREYNKLLERFNKANNYFENENIPNTEKEKYLSSFNEILAGLNYYLGKIEVYTNREILEGFHE